MNRLLVSGLVIVGAAVGQESPARVVVPLTDASRPVQLRVNLMSGSILVKGGAVKEVVVEEKGSSEGRRQERVPRGAEGLKRLNLGGSDLEVEESNNEVTVRSRMGMPHRSLVITVPTQTSVNLKSINNGEIIVEDVNGDSAVNNMNGKVTLRNVSGTVLANSMNGDVTVSMVRVAGTKPNSFSTMNGDIDVTLPSDVKARVKMKTNHGEVFSDFDIKPEASNSKPVVESEKGKYKVRFDQASYGNINGGGPEMQFSTFNGHIMIRKK